MEAIVNAKNPFRKIQNLPDMSMKFLQQYGVLLNKEADAMRPIIEDDLQKVLGRLEEKNLTAVFRNKVLEDFKTLEQKLDESHEIATVKNIRLESDTLKLRWMDDMDVYEAAHQPKPESKSITPVIPAAGEKPGQPEKTVIPSVQPKPKKRKNVSISNVAGARTYTLETEEDIDKFAEELKRKLKAQLEENTIIVLS